MSMEVGNVPDMLVVYEVVVSHNSGAGCRETERELSYCFSTF